MAQFLDFAVLQGKNAREHLALLRRIVKHVGTERPLQRKFAIWLRQSQVYDRAFIKLAVALLDLRVGRNVTLGEFGMELFEEMQKAPRSSEVEVPDPGAGGGRGGGIPGEALDMGPGSGPSPGQAAAKPLAAGGKPAPGARPEGAQAQAPPEPVDPVKEMLFDRLVELNGYLARFIFCEMGADFLAPGEMVKRIGSSIYHGERPNLTQFTNWLRWMEWLGYLKQVGFRHKLSPAGLEAWKYLKEIPESDLLEKGALAVFDGLTFEAGGAAETANDPLAGRTWVSAEELGAGPATEEGGGGDGDGHGHDEESTEALAAAVEEDEAAAGGEDREAGGAEGDEDRDLAEEEGLELPPEAEPLSPEEGGPAEEADEAAGELDDEGYATRMKALSVEAKKLRRETEAAAERAKALGDETETESESENERETRDEETTAAPAKLQGAAERTQAAAPTARKEAPPVRKPPSPARSPAPSGAAPARAALSPAGAAPSPAPPASAAAPAPAASGPGPALAPAPAPPVGDDATAAGIAALWESVPTRRPCSARDFGFDPAAYDAAEARPLFVFRLCAIACLLESEDAPFASKRAFFEDLERARALEGIFVRNWPLDKALEATGRLGPEADWTGLEERLVHLLRLRRALGREGGGAELVQRLERSATSEERAGLLRRAVAGNSLGGGAYWVAREMRRLGLWK